jgi:TonB dependent receptor
VTYNITKLWIISAAGIAQSGSYLFGDDANLTPKLPPFFTLTLSTSYQLTPHGQLFGEVDNVTNARYCTYGTFSPTTAVFLGRCSLRRRRTRPTRDPTASPRPLWVWRNTDYVLRVMAGRCRWRQRRWRLGPGVTAHTCI